MINYLGERVYKVYTVGEEVIVFSIKQFEEIRMLVTNLMPGELGNRVKAIKAVRTWNNCSLYAAKHVVDYIWPTS